jgi:hypothetical protein
VRAVQDGSVAVAGRDTGKVRAMIPLRGRARNFPMALDAKHHRIFIASRRPARLIVIDTERNAVIAEAPCIDDSDDLFYDPVKERVLVIGGGFRPDLQDAASVSPCSPAGEMGAIDLFSVPAGGELKRLDSTPTAPHARTGLFVPELRSVFIAVPPHGGHDSEIREYRVR